MIRVVFLVEDASFTTDSRVRRQSRSLREAGAGVAVICPALPGEPPYRLEDGVHVYRYRKPRWGEGFGAHLAEYGASLLKQTLLLCRVLRRHGFEVIHAANPPDLLWLPALPFKLLGKRFIYDQHDLVPELFEVRFGVSHGFLRGLVLALERVSYQLADQVICTNETFRRLAIQRGGRAGEDVTVVRNGPHLAVDFPAVEPDPEIRRLGSTVVGYLGNMNSQDHVENLLRVAHRIRVDRGRQDVGFVLIGTGDAFAHLRRLQDELGLAQGVLLTGHLPWDRVLAALAASNICVQPDAPSALNRHLTMNKLMEYMALGKAVVAFDMPETRVSGGDAVSYVQGESCEDLADAVLLLADDPERCRTLGRAARRRVETELSWERQSRFLLEVYRRLFPDGLLPGVGPGCRPGPGPASGGGS